VDRVIPKKRWSTKRLLTIGGILALALLIFASFYFARGGNKLNVDLDRITISEIKQDKFQETIPENGTVLPLITEYLPTPDGGKVAQIYVEDGAMLKAGDPILKLVNTEVDLSMANTANSVSAALAQLQLGQINAEQNTVLKLQTLADVEQLYLEAERVYNVDQKLYAQHVIGSQEFITATNNYNVLKQKFALQKEILRQDTVDRASQAKQDQESYVRAKATLQVMQEKVDGLILRAPIDGQLTSLDAEVGQVKTAGYSVGQIDAVNGFKVRLSDVDEHYLNRVFTGQTGTFTFSTNDSVYKLKIFKVFTAVANGRFQVDMKFVGKVPQGLRKGQTLQVTLALSDERTAILVPKGGFYQQTGGNWIFKLSEDGKTAYKVDIQLGQQNTDYYEVLSGLKPGDKVVTSSYENYGNMQELVLKK
jgi:HlyD family secretion protein